MNRTQARDRAAKLATQDPDAALKLAQEIEDPWFGCQALAFVARFAPEHQVQRIAEHALTASRRSPDPFRGVGSAAWAVRALVERNQTDRLPKIVGELLQRATTIENPASRSEALFLVFQAVLPAGRRFWEAVLSALVAASNPGVHWRQGRNLRGAILMIAGEDAELSAQLAERIAYARTRRRALRELANGERMSPRSFFWT